VRCQIARNAPSPSAVTGVVEFEPSNDVRPGPPPYRFTWEALPLQPPPAIECFDGQGGSSTSSGASARNRQPSV
jgi:hypothetical protein